MSWVGIDTDGLAGRRTGLRNAYDEISSIRHSTRTILTTVGEHVDLMPLIAIETFTEGWGRQIDTTVGAVDRGDSRAEWEHTLTMLGSADGALLRLAELGRARLDEIQAEIDALVSVPRHLVADQLKELETGWWRQMGDLAAILADKYPGEGWDVWEATAAYNLHHLTLESPDERLAVDSVERIQALLDQGWFGDVSRGELLEIGEVFDSLDPATATLVSASLTDGDWSRILRELDGARGGNLNVAEETSLFTSLVTRLSGDQIWRIMSAEEKGPEILVVAAQFAPPPVLFDLTHQAALHLDGDDQELALSTALTTLTTMGDADQQAATALLAESGTLADLLDAAARTQAELEAANEHGHPVVEFFKGAGGAVKGIWDGVYGLTLQVITDPHRWSTNWGDIGRVAEFAWNSPGDFLYQVADIDTLKDNPGYWLGGLVPDVAAAVFTAGTATAATRGAKLARLASALRSIDRVTPDSIRKLNLSHVRTTLRARLDNLTTRLADETGAIGTGAGRRRTDEILTDLAPGRTPPHRVVADRQALERTFRELSSDGVPVVSGYPGQLLELPEGTRIGLRQTSVSSGPTIDIHGPDGTVIKIHIGGSP
ncbi:MAG: hypothetical protein HKP18_11830 [Acidimicrobiia bacterium]|nr:hypothetical protein [Acidimicrobiia bacterium]